MKTCEKCGAEPEGAYGLLDYCAECSSDLCPKCMALGHCGHTPARSGLAADAPTDEEAAEDERRLAERRAARRARI